MRNFTHKFNSLFDLQSAFPTEKSCIKFLEQTRWHGNVISPFDPTSKFIGEVMAHTDVKTLVRTSMLE